MESTPFMKLVIAYEKCRRVFDCSTITRPTLDAKAFACRRVSSQMQQD